MTLVMAVLAASAILNSQAETASLSSDQQAEILREYGALLADHYILPDRADAYARALDTALAEGAFTTPMTASEFVEQVNDTLWSVAEDRHLGLMVPARFSTIAQQIGIENGDDEGHAGPATGSHAHHAAPSSGGIEDHRDREARAAEQLREIAGITRVSEISRDGLHQIGYLAFERLIGSDRSQRVVTNIMATFTESDRLLLDLRECRGGDVEAVRHLSSFLFTARTHLVSTDMPDGIRQERWTDPHALSTRLADKPLDILISSRTFSACESLAFGLHRTGRARLIGENTGGGGHMNGFYALPHGFGASISVGRTYDPRTGEGWEAAGVAPDLEIEDGHQLSETTALILQESGRLDAMSSAERAVYASLQAFTSAWYTADEMAMPALLTPDFTARMPGIAEVADHRHFLALTANGEGVLPPLYHNRMIRDVEIDGDQASARLILRETTHEIVLEEDQGIWRLASSVGRAKSRNGSQP